MDFIQLSGRPLKHFTPQATYKDSNIHIHTASFKLHVHAPLTECEACEGLCVLQNGGAGIEPPTFRLVNNPLYHWAAYNQPPGIKDVSSIHFFGSLISWKHFTDILLNKVDIKIIIIHSSSEHERSFCPCNESISKSLLTRKLLL